MASVAQAPDSEHGSFGAGSTYSPHQLGIQPLPGDVIVVQGSAWFSHVIEFAEGIAHLPQFSHVAVVSHTDPSGTLWCIEGRPGGVGYADTQNYLRQRGTLVNTGQPIPNEVRNEIAAEAKKMLGTPYDWVGIAEDAARDLNIPELWMQDWNCLGPPAHVVCSSFAAWLYRHFGLPSPAVTYVQQVEPGDWADFIGTKGWLR